MNAKDRMIRAEDYVFGLMDEQERARAERDMEVDAEFRECVTALAERLRKLHRAKGAGPLSDADWDAITTGIAGMPQMGGAGSRLAAMGMESPNAGRKGLLGIKRPGAHLYGGWRGTVIAAALAAALVLGYVAGQGTPAPTHPVAAALLADDAGTPAMLVETFADNSLRLLPLVEIGLAGNEVLQLWASDEGETLPVAVVPQAQEAIVQAPDELDMSAGRSYRMTVEPAPGGAAPSGRVLFTGEALAVPR